MSNYETINNCNQSINCLKLSYIEIFLGLSKTKVYTMLVNRELPYFKYQKIIRVFNEHLNEFINQTKYTNLADLPAIKSLPEIINASKIYVLLNISKSQIYKIIDSERFSKKFGKRIVVQKGPFIDWISSNMYYPK